ncbi:MAG: hypothetical protein VB009_06275 [Erysipelotrichaceae bacterium]|nr:hypothetical protein [Erysipelotrichaceae bacterium]
MGIVDRIMENPYYTALIITAVLALSEMLLWKKQMHYNRNTDNRMASSILNRKYHLNEKKNVDLEYINKTISLHNLAVIAVAGIIMIINLVAGVVAYTVFTVIINYYVAKKIAKKYEKSK